MTAQQQAVIRLVLEWPETLADVVHWVSLAEGLSFPEMSAVEMSVGGTRLTVSAFIGHTVAPDLAEDES